MVKTKKSVEILVDFYGFSKTVEVLKESKQKYFNSDKSIANPWKSTENPVRSP